MECEVLFGVIGKKLQWCFWDFSGLATVASRGKSGQGEKEGGLEES